VKNFKYIFMVFFYLLYIDSLSANADIYLATGVLTAEPKTDKLRLDLEADLIASNPKIYKNQTFKSAYNTTSGFWDFIESGSQLFQQNGWSLYWNSFIDLTNKVLTQHYIDYFTNVSKNHDVDLSEQITNYKTSINAGNQVIVIAHSQGNYFTNEAYDSLSPCQKKYFYMLGVANPASKVSGESEGRGKLATLDNDPITYVPSSMGPNIINSERFTIAGTDLKHYKFHFFEYYRTKNSVTKYKIDTFAEYAIDHFNINNLEKNSIQPKSGIIEVSLTWDNPSIQMSLSSAIGSKDVSASECSPLEHYYVQSKDEVSPGTYAVSVSNSGNVDESSLPQNINVNIRTPGAASVFSINVTAADMLNLGNVADIIISEDKKTEIVAVDGIGSTKCYGNCSGSSGSGNSGSGGTDSGSIIYSGTYPDYLYKIKSKLKQALLGPLSNAKITLAKAQYFANNMPFYESSTSEGDSLLTSGIFYFTSAALNSLQKDVYYVLSANGGDDIDANDDGELDTIPTQNFGSIHAVVDEYRLKNENFKVTILSEVAFQLTKKLMLDDLNTTLLQETLDVVATKLLKEDVNGDKEINYDDVLAWQPMYDKEKLLKPYDKFYEAMVQKLYKNEDIYADASVLLLPYIGELISSVPAQNSIYAVSLSPDGSKAYVADGTSGLQIIDVSNPPSPVTVSSVDIPGNALDISLSPDGSKAYVAAGYLGLQIIDVSNPSNPVIMGSVDTRGYAQSVSLSPDGSKAYIAAGQSGLQIIDVRNPSNPVIMGSVDTPGSALGVSLSADGSKAYVADESSGLQIIDFGNRPSPIVIKSVETREYARSSLSPRASVSPGVIIGSVDTLGNAYSISLSADGSKAYVAAGQSGLQIIDVSNPSNPVIMGSVDTPGSALGVSLSADGSKAYVADESSGLQIIDVSNPVNLVIMGSVDTPGSALGVSQSSDGSKTYVADGYLGLQIIDIFGL